MKPALITPTAFVNHSDLMPSLFCIGSIAMRSKYYRRFFIDRTEGGKRTVILDNGAFEGNLLTASELHDLAVEIKPSVVVAPDLYGGNTAESYSLSQSFVESEQDYYRDIEIPVPWEFMLVMQTELEDQDSFYTLLPTILQDSRFSYLGIPRILAHNFLYETLRETNQELLRYCFMSHLELLDLATKKIHYLGMGNSVHLLQHSWWTSTIDSAAPFWQAWLGNSISKEGILATISSRPAHYFNLHRVSAGFEDLLRHNCTEVLRWVEKAEERRRLITGDLYRR